MYLIPTAAEWYTWVNINLIRKYGVYNYKKFKPVNI